MNVKIIFFATILIVLMGCKGKSTSSLDEPVDSIPLKYAEHISMVKHKLYTVVNLQDPWHTGKTLHTYILIDRHDSAKVHLLPQGTVVYTPVERSVVFTTAHCKLLEMLGMADKIKGVADLKYILIPAIQHRVKTHLIVDCGNAMSPTIEKIISIKPQAILLSPFENSGGYGQIEKIGCPIIELADYMETSPLGRAEWMKFYGILFGCEQRADSLFQVVDSSYQALKAQAKKWNVVRKMLTEQMIGSVWYCPGGKSTIAQMIRDANGHYAFANDTHSGSLPLSFEEVLAKAGNSDVWALKYNGTSQLTRQILLSQYHGYKALQAFQYNNIYVCYSSITPFFEETPFRPDYLLRDFIIMLHPEASSFGQLKYFVKLTS